jgi:hypothetical protein
MASFFEKYGTAIVIVIGILLVLAFTVIGAIVGRIAMVGTFALLVWLALRLLQFVSWHEYWEKNAAIGAGAVVLFALTAYVMYFDPRMPNLDTGPCHVSRYESC